METLAEPRYPLESVGNALVLIQLFGERPSVRVTEVAERLGVAPSTVHRLLAMLEHHGFVRRHPGSHTYRLGPTLLSVATAIASHTDIRSAVRPHLEALVSTKTLRAVSRAGKLVPAYATASGKALLAELSTEQLYALYPDEPLPTLTRRTIATRSQLLSLLQGVKNDGFARNFGESEIDICGYASAIRDRFGAVRASIALTGPVRLKRIKEADIVTALKAACDTVGRALP